MSMRACAAAILCVLVAAPAYAQQQAGEMQLYIQQLEERVRQLTGENERLAYEVRQLRTQLGLPAEGQPGAVQPGDQQGSVQSGDVGPGQPPQQLGSVSPNDPLISQDGDGEGEPAGAGAPVDLSALASGVAGEMFKPGDGSGQPGADGQQQASAESPPATLTGSPRDEYDLAYGYILTGDYGLAEESFKAWLATFPSDKLAGDAEFWLGESQLQQGEYRSAANAFLSVYKTAPDGGKGPDALLKLGMSLSALGEKTAACATFDEVSRRYPQVSPSLKGRVHDEAKRAGC